MVWEILKFDEDYEIETEYPYNIRRKGNDKIISEFNNSKGYIKITLNQRNYFKHRVIAIQWLENPNNLEQVDHINRDKGDYHLSNLRWVSQSENQINTISHNGIKYNYVDTLSDEAFEVKEYNGNRFEFLFYDPVIEAFFHYNGIQYRELHIMENINGSLYVQFPDVNRKRRSIFYNKFKRAFGLI